MGTNVIRDQTYQFALASIAVARDLTERREYVLSRQLLRSATSVGANVEEALAAQSSRDFRAKFAIARKEARESHYWLRLLRDSALLDPSTAADLIDKAEFIIRILTSIIPTSEARDQPRPLTP
ncbi:MAG: four helix bundle protein [Gemmatimonadetes bacterium]|nr:four helix bundle protein [Gemmatimonadota bacterium]